MEGQQNMINISGALDGSNIVFLQNQFNEETVIGDFVSEVQWLLQHRTGKAATFEHAKLTEIIRVAKRIEMEFIPVNISQKVSLLKKEYECEQVNFAFKTASVNSENGNMDVLAETVLAMAGRNNDSIGKFPSRFPMSTKIENDLELPLKPKNLYIYENANHSSNDRLEQTSLHPQTNPNEIIGYPSYRKDRSGWYIYQSAHASKESHSSITSSDNAKNTEIPVHDKIGTKYCTKCNQTHWSQNWRQFLNGTNVCSEGLAGEEGNQIRPCSLCGTSHGSSKWYFAKKGYVCELNFPFKCTKCPKSFESSSLLRSHEMIHLAEKPHSCQYCEKAFARRHDMLRHERNVHVVKVTDCKTCNMVFATRNTLKQHCQITKHIPNMPKPLSSANSFDGPIDIKIERSGAQLHQQNAHYLEP